MRLETIGNYGRMGLLLLAASLTTGLAFGQSANTGEFKGTVIDSSGAVVAGATVTITDVQTGVSTVTATNSDGIYYFREGRVPHFCA